MKQQILIFLLFQFSFSLIFAQLTAVELRTQYSALGKSLPVNRNPNSVLDMRLRDTKGTPYIQEEWLPGTVYLKSGIKREHVLINYDVVEDKPIIQGEQGGDVYITPKIVDYFVMRDNKIIRVFHQFPHPRKKDEYIFMEILEAGKVSLIMRRRRYFVPADYSNSAYNSQINAEYKSLPDQFFILREGDSKLYKLKKSRGKFLKMFKDKRSELKSYFNENDIYGGMEHQEVLNAVEYYNSLN